MKRFFYLAIAVVLSMPTLALAQFTPFSYGGGTTAQINDANGLIRKILDFGSVAIYLLVALAVVYIVYAAVQYVVKGKEGDESRAEAGKQIMWGIIGLFIIVSIWGLVNILVNTFPTNNYVPVNLPNANFVNTNGTTGTNGAGSAPVPSGYYTPSTSYYGSYKF